jgi:hypothetical protein
MGEGEILWQSWDDVRERCKGLLSAVHTCSWCSQAVLRVVDRRTLIGTDVVYDHLRDAVAEQARSAVVYGPR